jgi:hypothetical protein
LFFLYKYWVPSGYKLGLARVTGAHADEPIYAMGTGNLYDSVCV